MAAVRKLTGIPAKTLSEQVGKLNNVPGAGKWIIQLEGEKSALNVAYNFKSFAMTWKFLNSLVLPIQQLRHHPTITTTYNAVEFSLTTHDLGNKVSLLDLRLALVIADHYRQMGLMGVRQKPDTAEMSLTEANTILHDLILDSDPAGAEKRISLEDSAVASIGVDENAHDLGGIESRPHPETLK